MYGKIEFGLYLNLDLDNLGMELSNVLQQVEKSKRKNGNPVTRFSAMAKLNVLF